MRPAVTQQVTEGSRLALSVAEAAEALGVSRDSFERHVISELHLVRVGRRLLVPTQELERWIERQMAIPLVAELSGPAARHRFLGGQRAE